MSLYYSIYISGWNFLNLAGYFKMYLGSSIWANSKGRQIFISVQGDRQDKLCQVFVLLLVDS